MRYVLFFVCIIAASASLFAQKKGTGLIYNPSTLRGVPYKAKLTSQSYKSMPAAVSLENFCPEPGDQGPYGTCVAFASAYHLRTILYNKVMSEAGQLRNKSLVFSPSYVYEQIKEEGDADCQGGSDPVMAFELMKNLGAATTATCPYACGSNVSTDAMLEGLDFRIADYQILYLPDETNESFKINAVKKALSEGYPCLLGFIVAESFYQTGPVWREQASDDGPTGKHGRHAMCIVGYNDQKEGGAFRIMNSWGNAWADKGFVWVPYADFAKYALLAIQAYPAPLEETPVPAPSPAPPQPTPVDPVLDVILSGEASFQLNTGEIMSANRVLTRNLVVEEEVPVTGESLVAYRMDQAYGSGTRFRFFITTNSESYIYAFATDLSGKVNKILPFADNMSPHIGANSQVAFPSETKIVKMDSNPGTDYMLILFAQEPLNAEVMLQEMNKTRAGLSSKINAALGNKLIAPANINYAIDKIGFEVKNTNHKGTVVPLMVEITHN
jgi:hypothetical protein